MNLIEQIHALLGAGAVTAVVGDDPAADTEFEVVVGAGKLYKLLAVEVELVQGATQTPLPALVIDDGTTEIWRANGAASAQNASVTATYRWAPGVPISGGGAGTANYGPLLTGFCLSPGWRVRSVTAGKGANSNYGAPTLYVVEAG